MKRKSKAVPKEKPCRCKCHSPAYLKQRDFVRVVSCHKCGYVGYKKRHFKKEIWEDNPVMFGSWDPL